MTRHAPEAVPAPSSTEPAQDSQASLWGNRDFRLVLVGQGASALGDAVSFTALPLLVVLLTGSGVQMGVVGVLQTLPDLLFGLPAGAVADRWDRRRMMLYADLGRAVLTALIPLSFVVGVPAMAVVFLVTAPINLLRVVFLAAYTASVPSLVGKENVGRANSLGEAFFSLCFLIGPVVAGVLVGIIGPGPTIALDALSFLASSAALALVRRPLQAAQRERETRLRSDIADGIGFIWRHPVLRPLVAFWSLVSVVSAPVTAAAIYHLSVDRGLPSATVGFVVSTFALGYLVGALLAGQLGKGRIGLAILVASLMNGVVLIGLPVAPTFPALLVGALLAGATWSVVLVSYITVRTVAPPDELLGRVGSTARTLSLGLQPLGMFVGGILLDLGGGRLTLTAIGIAVIGISLAFVLSAALRGAVLDAVRVGS